MVGRLYWASCARATSIDALLRHSPPPASCGRLYPEAAGRRILAGDRLYPASRSRYRRSAASLSPCCAAANIRQQQAGGFRWPAVYTGGGQAVRGQRAQMLCCAALSASFCRQYTATAIQRSRPTPCTTAKPCYCKSCVTAFGGWPRASRAWQRAQTFCCVALPVLCCRKYPATAVRQISEAGWLYWGGTSRARAAGIDALLRRSPPRVVLPPIYGDSDSTVAPYTVHYR